MKSNFWLLSNIFLGEVKMKKILNLIVIAAAMSLCVNAWAAEKMKEPTVEYSADMTMASDQGSMNSKIYSALGGKQRWEMASQGQNVIMITRQDKKVAWTLMPQQNTYMEMSLTDASKKTGNNVNECDMDISSEGSETVNGVRATKSKVSMSCPDNSKYDGTMWVTKEGIMVKMDAVAGQGSDKGHIKIDLTNLKIGSQDASLFEIPAGYQKFSMGDISSMFKSQAEAAKAQAEAAKAQAEADKARAEADKAASESSGGRAYTAQGRAYTASETKKPSAAEKVIDGVGSKLKGLFKK
jgi:outer membrane lipoprotein-sorting protein